MILTTGRCIDLKTVELDEPLEQGDRLDDENITKCDKLSQDKN